MPQQSQHPLLLPQPAAVPSQTTAFLPLVLLPQLLLPYLLYEGYVHMCSYCRPCGRWRGAGEPWGCRIHNSLGDSSVVPERAVGLAVVGETPRRSSGHRAVPKWCSRISQDCTSIPVAKRQGQKMSVLRAPSPQQDQSGSGAARARAGGRFPRQRPAVAQPERSHPMSLGQCQREGCKTCQMESESSLYLAHTESRQ